MCGNVGMGDNIVLVVIGIVPDDAKNEVRKDGERRVNVAIHGFGGISPKFSSNFA